MANIASLPVEIKELYKTVWEIKQKVIIDQAADRGAFICQSQSLNIHMADPTNARLTSMHFYAWKKGLKTGMYYLRSRPKAEAIQFTVDQTALAKTKKAAATPATPLAPTTAVTPATPIGKGGLVISPMSPVTNDENFLANKSTVGLDYAAEAACENCSA